MLQNEEVAGIDDSSRKNLLGSAVGKYSKRKACSSMKVPRHLNSPVVMEAMGWRRTQVTPSRYESRRYFFGIGFWEEGGMMVPPLPSFFSEGGEGVDIDHGGGEIESPT